MRVELDHFFVCTDRGAPEAEVLVRFGLVEGPPNQHPGQGTASRRFSFANAMIELVWVSDSEEAQSDATRRTRLWERWSGREGGASPFGICLRPVGTDDVGTPFGAWQYRPAYLSDPLVMDIAEVGAEEPMWVFMSFMRREYREGHFVGHPAGVREITGLTLTTPVPLRSEAALVAIEKGVLSSQLGAGHLLEVEFDGGRRGERVEFAPHLPLAFRL